MKLRRESNVALYVQIAASLARDIAEGRYRTFDRLPTEHELMERFAVSRITVRQAIARLVEQGLAVSKQGKGSFVAGPVVQHELEELRGFYDTLVGQGHVPTTRLLAFGPQQAPADVARELGGEPGDGALPVYLKRRYALQGKPFALARAWLPPQAQRLSWEDAERHPLYALLADLLGRKVARAEVGIVAREGDAEECEVLGLPPASPVLVMERVSYADDGSPLEISQFSIRPENYRFRLRVQGPLAITRQIEAVGARAPSPPPHRAARRKSSRQTVKP